MGYLANYKSFMAVYTFSEELAAYIGTVANCEDKIVFSGRSPAELQHAFKQSVDLYLITCKAKGKKPAKEMIELLGTGRLSLEQPSFHTSQSIV